MTRGSEVTAWLVTVPPRVASVVSIGGASAVTVTVCVCAPGVSFRSTRTSCGHLEQHVGAFDRLESLGLGAHRVGADEQAGRCVLTGLVGRQRARGPSSHVGDRHFGAGNRCPRGIINAPQDRPHSALREKARGYYQHHHHEDRQDRCCFLSTIRQVIHSQRQQIHRTTPLGLSGISALIPAWAALSTQGSLVSDRASMFFGSTSRRHTLPKS